ncbi:YdgA family protein [Deinococcus cavernae]|nr:YdgA family protein [Deinococcus cavernae]
MSRPNTVRPAQKRRSPLPAVLLSAVVTAGAVAGATAVFSGRTQQTTEEFAQKLTSSLNASGVVTAQQTGYQKGFASSTQTMTVNIAPEDAGKPVQLLVTNHIKHGPFPGMRGVGQAIVDTDIRFADAQTQAQFERAFAGKKPTIRTLIGLGGDTSTQIEVPGGRVTEDGSTMTWQALQGDVTVSGQTTTTNLTWPGLKITGADGQGELGAVTLKGRTHRQNEQDQLGTGTSTFKIASMKFTSAGQTVRLNNMEVSGDSRLSDPEHYDGVVKYTIGELAFADKNLKNVQLHLGVRHLAREPLNRLLGLVNDMQRASTQASRTQASRTQASSTPDLTPAQEKQLGQDMLALLKDSPRLTLDRLSLTQPGGEILLTGQASAPRMATMTVQQLELLTDQPAVLATMADIHLEAGASEQALTELLGLFGGRLADLGGTLQPMIEQGYVVKQGDQLRAVLDFKDGTPTLNGKALGD